MAGLVITLPEDEGTWNLDTYGTRAQVWFDNEGPTPYLRIRVYLNGGLIHETPTGYYPQDTGYYIYTSPGYTLETQTQYTMYISGGYYDGGWVWTDVSPTITFTTYQPSADPPSKPTNPTPANAADDVTLDQATVTWEDGGGATSYNVYYGTESENLSLVSEGQAETSFTVTGITNGAPYDYEITRYWRIDAVNDVGTTTGDEWSFTTIVFNAPPPGLRGYDKTGGGEGDFAGGAIGDGQLNIKTRLVAFANNKVWYEDV
jgi:hypothetical protein